jgi:2-polyprenyl-3-methyl-5-hydroxy-6-metoxy-1,4-benzoquinol methylase
VSKSYEDITPDYDEYLNDQAQRYLSFESLLPGYHMGMHAAVNWFVQDRPMYGFSIADIACGDGYQSRLLTYLGAHVTGIDLSILKTDAAKLTAEEDGLVITYLAADFHQPNLLPVESLDVLFSSHSLEHAYDPGLVLRHFYSYLKPGGEFWLILPYPDSGPDKAHGGKYGLGTNKLDSGQSLRDTLAQYGFRTLRYKMESLREPEIWVHAEKV